MHALIRRAQAILNDESIDPQSRASIRYAMERNDPWLARLVLRAVAGEAIVDGSGFDELIDTYDDDLDEEKIETLMEMICRARAELTTRSSFRSLFMSPIRIFPGPPCTATGDPGAFVNSGCCDAFEGALPEEQEVNNDVHDAITNRINRPTLAGMLITKLIALLLSLSELRRFGVAISSGKSCFVVKFGSLCLESFRKLAMLRPD